MKISSFFISSVSKDSGKFVTTIGLIRFLKANFHRVAFFKPITIDKKDSDIEFIHKYFNLNMDISQMSLYSVDEVEKILYNNDINKIISDVIKQYQVLIHKFDFVVVQGLAKEYIDFIDTNLDILLCKNLSIPYINIINGYQKSKKDIVEIYEIEKKTILSQEIDHLATFVTKVKSKNIQLLPKDIFILPYIKDLDTLTMDDIFKNIESNILFGSKKYLNKQIKDIKVASMTTDNFLKNIQNKDLIITSADRTDIIISLILSLQSKQGTKVSGIILSGNITPSSYIVKLIKGIDNFPITILSTKYDTHKTSKIIDSIKPAITTKSYTKISLIFGMFDNYIDVSSFQTKLDIDRSNHIMTPLMFEYHLLQKAKKDKKTIVLPESNDDRILRATEILLNTKVVDIILLGEANQIDQRAKQLGLKIKNATIIDPKNSPLSKKFADQYYLLREDKGILKNSAFDIMQNDFNFFATMMVQNNLADGMVSGANHTTANTIRPALQIIKTVDSVDIVSSLFFMCLDTKILIYADCAINIDPNPKELAQIALSSAQTAKSFGLTPKVAMLSYSTGDSGSGTDVQKVNQAVQYLKSLDIDFDIDGPLQYDAAIDKNVAKKKMPNSKVAGVANILIFPDLNTGNNTYKAVQRSSNAIAIGPVLQGLKKPINDLSRGCNIKDIINTVIITAIQAQDIG
jgi:phosphate acetyltransferase